MTENLQAAARKEIDRMKKAISAVTLAHPSREGEKVFALASAYLSDAEHFFGKGKYLEAFEASVICWGYLDAGLHLGAFLLSDESVREVFTV